MQQRTLGDWLALTGFVLIALGWFACVWAIFRLRRRDRSLSRFLLGAPLWLFAPSEYFIESRKLAPIKYLSYWLLGSIVVITLGVQIHIWLQ